MKLCVIGTGYVGLVAGTCLAERGNNVICVDKDLEKLENLKRGIIPIYEPGLEDLIKTNVKEGRLKFSDNISDAVKESLICFIAVGTPQVKDGSVNMENVYQAAEEIGKSINEYQGDVLEQVRNDIQSNVSFIESKITQYGLDGYSMYIYLLPFADADEDKKDIMDKLLQSGGGQA